MEQSAEIGVIESTDAKMRQDSVDIGSYPFSTSERYQVASAPCAKTIEWIREKYGEEIATFASIDFDPTLETSEHIRDARLFVRHGIQALQIPDVNFVLSQDVQTGLLLAKRDSRLIDSLKALHQNMQRGINGVQIHRSGVTGIEPNATTVFLPSALHVDQTVQTYMTSIPQLRPRDGETESEMQQRLFQERRNAFTLYKELLDTEHMQGLHATDLQHILEVCFRLTNGQQPSFILTTGFGGSEDQPSTRMPSYISGACEILRIFKRYRDSGSIRHMPKLRILNAFKIAGLVNHMDTERIGKSAQNMQSVLRSFVDRFAPDIAECVYFETDEGISYPTMSEAQEYFAHLPTEHPSHQKIASQAARMMKKERLNNQEEAVHRVQQYIAAHISIFLDVIASDWHGGTSYVENKPDIVWSIGGKGEQFFNEFRRMFSEDRQGPDHLHASYHPLSVRTLQKAGQHPPYYHLHPVDTSVYELNGEPIVPDITSIKDKAVAKSIDVDYKALLSMVKNAVAREHGRSESDVADAEADATLKSFFLSLGKHA